MITSISKNQKTNLESGSILVELVFILPLFLFIAFCGFELSRIMQAKQKTSMMAYEAARQAASECYYNLPTTDENGKHYSIGANSGSALTQQIQNFYSNCLNRIAQRFTKTASDSNPSCSLTTPCLSITVLAPKVNNWNEADTSNLPEGGSYREIARTGTGGGNSGGTNDLSKTAFFTGGSPSWKGASSEPYPFAYKFNFTCGDCDNFLQQLAANSNSFILDLLAGLGANQNTFDPVQDDSRRDSKPSGRFVPDMVIVAVAGANYQSITGLTDWLYKALNTNNVSSNLFMLSSEVAIHF